MGTSSMPLGLMTGASTPSPLGSQSELAPTVSYRRTSASLRLTPTLNCTVSTAMPERDTLMTWSTPVICESTCSAGVATSDSTSFAAAPGKGMMTLAIVTSIWGSSSRGVTRMANRPSRKATRARSGVIWAASKKAAIRPEMPRRAVLPEVSGVGGMASRMGKGSVGRHCARAAACGSVTTRSPACRPERISTVSPWARPRRTWRSRGRLFWSST